MSRLGSAKLEVVGRKAMGSTLTSPSEGYRVFPKLDLEQTIEHLARTVGSDEWGAISRWQTMSYQGQRGLLIARIGSRSKRKYKNGHDIPRGASSATPWRQSGIDVGFLWRVASAAALRGHLPRVSVRSHRGLTGTSCGGAQPTAHGAERQAGREAPNVQSWADYSISCTHDIPAQSA